MKKKIFMLLVCMLVVTAVGIPSGRKYIRYATNFVRANYNKVIDEPARDSTSVAKLQITYKQLRDSIDIQRRIMAKKYLATTSETSKKKIIKEAGLYLKDVLIDRVYPCWYGTEWDFNGITESPRKGQIACGYFVSTTLRHVGVNVNRYKLAQKYSHAIVKSICTDVKVYHDFKELLSALKNKTDDVYVVGLDNHVGLISKKGEQINFVHSSYVSPSYVISETAENSAVLGGSSIYVLGNMTSNSALIYAWLTGTAVKVLE